VLDVSVAISWLFVDERDEDSQTMAHAVARYGALVPPLFRWELQNALLTAVRHGRMEPDQVKKHLESVEEIGVETDGSIMALPLTTGLGLAQRFQLTAYDAAYLELAIRRSAPLMTRDQKLARAAEALDLSWKHRPEL
jgi:predicted nucleic acid-binding protein